MGLLKRSLRLIKVRSMPSCATQSLLTFYDCQWDTHAINRWYIFCLLHNAPGSQDWQLDIKIHTFSELKKTAQLIYCLNLPAGAAGRKAPEGLSPH